MLIAPMDVDNSPRKNQYTHKQKQTIGINKWRYSYITPVSKKGSNVEFLNENFVSDSSNSDSMYVLRITIGL